MFSARLTVYLIVGVVLLTFFTILLIRNSIKTKRTKNLARRIEKDPQTAINISQELASLMVEIDCPYNKLFEKLDRLKYELDISYTRIYKCHKLNDTSFLLITSYEHLDTSKSDAVENYFEYNYKFQLDKARNKVSIYTDGKENVKNIEFKKSFIQGFFKKYIGITLEK
jgi:hypothetical protein